MKDSTISRDFSRAVHEGQYNFLQFFRSWTYLPSSTSWGTCLETRATPCTTSPKLAPRSCPPQCRPRKFLLLSRQKPKRSAIRLVFSSSNFVPPDILGHLFLRPLLWNRPPDLNFLVHVQFLDCTGNVSFIPSSLNELWPNWLMRIYKNNAMIISFKKDLISVTSFDFILWYVKRIRLSVPLLRWRGIFAF